MNRLFIFNNEYFLQHKGTAMGATCAPVFAHLYMGFFEEHFILNNDSFTHYMKWFIDDLFVIWRGPEEDLKVFLSPLNNNDWGLTFSEHVSISSIEFLDIKIFITKNKLETKTSFNTIDANSFSENSGSPIFPMGRWSE